MRLWRDLNFSPSGPLSSLASKTPSRGFLPLPFFSREKSRKSKFRHPSPGPLGHSSTGSPAPASRTTHWSASGLASRLHACGTTARHAALADRIAAWALPLARTNTNRISRAHLECAAAGDGHEALHRYLASFEKKYYEQLARIGHTSGLDAAAGAVLALGKAKR
jgi:hypothetical protein